MSADRYRRKADITVAAWRALLGETPTRNALVRVMSVAEFETNMGDGGFHNWGGVQKRALRPDESAILLGHGIFPGGGVDALGSARGLLTAAPNETLALDTSPVIGPYFTWFWSFSDDVDAAKKFLEVLVLQRPGVRAILDSAGPDELARAMFESRYYEGFHKKDPEANIRDYARMIGATGALIEAALGGAPGGPGASSAAAGFGLVLFFGTLGLLLMRGAR